MKTCVAGILVRRMRAADLEHVITISASLKQAPQWPRTAYASMLNRDATPRRIALVAEDQESRAVAGFAVASLLVPQAELESIAVAAEHQRRGIGRKLLAAMVEEMKAGAASEFILEVRASNEGALGLYRSMGWSEAGRRQRYYVDPEEDAILMSLGLG
jgi:[ribosomal protein S18]-alanine N-acetyltransferase